MRGIGIVGASGISVRVEIELAPLRLVELLLLRGHGRVGGQLPIAGEHPLAQVSIRAGVGRKLPIAVEITFADAVHEARHQIVDVDDAYDALELDALLQSETHAADHPEQPIAADRQAKEFVILVSAAMRNAAVTVHQRERFDVADDWLEREPAAVNVGAERAPERQPVSAGLLLNDAPGPGLPPLHDN